MCSTHPDRSILLAQIDLSGCVVCVAHPDRSNLHAKIDLSGCVVCVAHIQIDLSYTHREIYLDV